MSAHTPGPWKVRPHPRFPTADPIAVEGPGRKAICMFSWTQNRNGDVPVRGNARLIAAAPALADALEGLQRRYPDEPRRFCDHAAAPCPRCDAAIAALRAAGRLP